MTIFGVRIMFEIDYQLALGLAADREATERRKELEFWKAKYYYAKARALVAEEFPHKMTVLVRPRENGADVEVTRG